VCDNARFVRQDLLDQIVWSEVVRLLEDPTLIQQELDRRLAAARSSDPTKQREQNLRRELTRVGNSLERLLTAYQEELSSLEQLRERMPPLRQREQALRAELQAIADQTSNQATFLRLAETLAAFLGRLRSTADTLDIMERQRIVRLVVKEVLIGDDNIIIRHSIPIASTPPPSGGPPAPSWPDGSPTGQSYLLCKGRNLTILGELNKLAVNISEGRNMSGIHWRVSDDMLGMLLGENVAIYLLNETAALYPEQFKGFTLTKFDGTTILVGNNVTG
jgi:site-specific DNA recombinase